MMVKDLIEKLKQFDPNLPVCLTDWNEGWTEPDERAAEVVELWEDCNYFPKDSGGVYGNFVAIGGGDRKKKEEAP